MPTALTEIVTLGRTLKKRAADVLAYFDRPGTSNGPTEAINGRLEHLRGSALGFRNLTNYVARSLLETGGFRPHYTLDCEEPDNRLFTAIRRRFGATGPATKVPEPCTGVSLAARLVHRGEPRSAAAVRAAGKRGARR